MVGEGTLSHTQGCTTKGASLLQRLEPTGRHLMGTAGFVAA